MSPNTLPFGRRIVSAADSTAFARAPIASRLVPPPIVVGPTREDEIEARIAAARAEGYEAGRLDATAEPRLEVEREQAAALSEFVGTIAAAAERVATDRKRMVDEMTSEVADLAFAVVESVLGANLTGADELRGALLKALELVPSNEAIVVRLHPGAPIDPSSLTDLVETTTLTVVSDPSVVPNGCVVEAGASRIDAQIPTAVDRARRVFETLRYDYQESSRS